MSWILIFSTPTIRQYSHGSHINKNSSNKNSSNNNSSSNNNNNGITFSQIQKTLSKLLYAITQKRSERLEILPLNSKI